MKKTVSTISFTFKRALLLIFIIIQHGVVFPQINLETRGSWYCHQNKINHKLTLPDKSPNSPVHSFDVLKYTLNLDLYDCYSGAFPGSFKADEIIRFRADTALSEIKLNAVNSSMVIDSVSLSGVSFTHSNNILTITLDRVYNPSEIADVKIYYRHLDVDDGAFYTGNGFVFTDCEPEGARKWFPCWDKPSDKALTDITAKVPDNVLLASNGRLQDSVHIADTIFYNWVSRDPLATYLTVITSKAGYNLDVLYWTLPSDTNTKIPIRYYYNTGEDPSPSENAILDMTSYFSNTFCEHPFEKNGFCTLNSQFPWGGMENQTLTSFCPNCWAEWLTAHEFAHQWFGDMITCGTWADIFLNEGFATYIENLWLEHTSGYSVYKSEMINDANYYLQNNPGRAVCVPSWATTTPPISDLFDYAVTYCKGSAILHMFRYSVGDSLFFAALKSYAGDTANFKYKNAVIPDFMAKMNQVCNQNLDWFWNEWLYQPNHPIYDNTYNFEDNGNGTWTVNFTASQTQPTGFFQMPLQIQIHFADGSSVTEKVMNNYNGQLFQFTYSKDPDALVFDPLNEILLKEGGTTVGIRENDPDNTSPESFLNSPNPFSDKTSISFELPMDARVKISVYDISGELISVICDEKISAGKHEVEFNSGGLSGGVYYCRAETCRKTTVMKMIIIK